MSNNENVNRVELPKDIFQKIGSHVDIWTLRQMTCLCRALKPIYEQEIQKRLSLYPRGDSQCQIHIYMRPTYDDVDTMIAIFSNGYVMNLRRYAQYPYYKSFESRILKKWFVPTEQGYVNEPRPVIQHMLSFDLVKEINTMFPEAEITGCRIIVFRFDKTGQPILWQVL